LSSVGNVYFDAATNKKYQCTATITLSPTLINDKETKFSYWQNVFSGSGEVTEIEPKTIILKDEMGNEFVAVLVDEEVDFTATANDIREGKVAVTDDGVTIGDKFIPSYHTVCGVKTILNGQPIQVTGLTKHDNYDYTKFQAVICPFDGSVNKSVAAEIISIDDNVYNVRSTDSLATLIKNHEDKTVDFGLNNDLGVPCIVRYITYKEVE
jgi:hypothetical protein